MPLYEYRCRECGKTFEMLRRMPDADREVECPECQCEEVERLHSTFATAACGAPRSGRFT
ncbi:MAG: FmdB family zinc ribbon protein [Bryobacteraceae bacterium]